MRLFSTLLVLVASSSAFAVTRGGGNTNPPAGGAAAAPLSFEQAIKAQSKKHGSDPHNWEDVTLDSGDTLFDKMSMVVGNGTNGKKHGDCEADDTMVDTFSAETLAKGCQPKAEVMALRSQRKASADAKAARIQSEWNHGVLSGGDLRCHDVVTKDGAGQDVTIVVCDGIVDIKKEVTELKSTVAELKTHDTEQDSAIGNAQTDATAAKAKADQVEAALGLKVDMSTYSADVTTQQAIDAGQERRLTEQGEKIAKLWDGAHFTGFLAPAYVYLDGGTKVTVEEDSDIFAGETLAFGQRGAFGVAGGIGGEWQWGGLMATGSVGVMGEFGNQVGAFGVVAYYPIRASGTVQVDLGLEGSYLEAGDRLFNTTYAGSTSKLSGFGGGPSLAIGIGGGPTKLDLRAALLIGGVNQQLTVAVDDSGDSVLEDQGANAFVISVGGRFGGAPR